MNDWVVETPTFEEDLMNNRVVMLNRVGVDRVVEIIKEKDKEIERLNNIIKEVREYIERKRLTTTEVTNGNITYILEILDNKKIYGDKLQVEWYEESILDKGE